MQADYDFLLIEHRRNELEQASALLRIVFPHARHLTPRHLDWQYRGSPDGRAIACGAYRRGHLVGHVAALPLRARLNGEEHSGVILVNAAVHPEHRRRNLTVRMTFAAMDEVFRQGHRFALAVGNAVSTGALMIGFRPIAPLLAKLGFGTPARSLPVEPSFERLWSEQALRWRLASPVRRYVSTVRNSRLVVTAVTGRPGIAALLHDGPELGAFAASGRWQSPARLWIGLDPAIDWKRSRFVDIPGRLKPSPLNLTFVDLTGRDLFPDPARILFRPIDFDAF